jgi:hypothetical protein
MQLAMPDQGFSIPTDLETILLGRINAIYGDENEQAQPAESVSPGTIGYIVQ